MAPRRILAGLAWAGCWSVFSAAAAEEVALAAALSGEDACDSSEECGLELRQLRGNLVGDGCADHCKYEGQAVWQYDPGCKACKATALLETQADPSCVDHCKYEGSAVWQYDPLCKGCKAASLEEEQAAPALLEEEATPGCADYCMWTGVQVWSSEPDCKTCKLETPFAVADGCDSHCVYIGPLAWGKDPGCLKCGTPVLLLEGEEDEEEDLEECPTAAMVGTWQAHAKLSFLKDPLQVDMIIKAADNSECPALTALLKVPGQEIHYDIQSPKQEGSALKFKFQNNMDKAPYWHPGVFNAKDGTIKEQLSTVGVVATGKVQTGTDGVLGMKEFKFHKLE